MHLSFTHERIRLRCMRHLDHRGFVVAGDQDHTHVAQVRVAAEESGELRTIHGWQVLIDDHRRDPQLTREAGRADRGWQRVDLEASLNQELRHHLAIDVAVVDHQNSGDGRSSR